MVTVLTPNRPVQNLNFLQPNSSQSRQGSTLPTEYKPANDTVSISSAGKISSILSSRLPSAKTNSVSVVSIEEDFLNATSFVEERLQSLYRQIGISSISQMEITVGYDGSILVDGEGSESNSLAAAINADDELANNIRGMSAMASALEAIKKHQEFVAAYEKDPLAAVDRYGYLLEDGHEYQVSFSIKTGKIDTRVEYI